LDTRIGYPNEHLGKSRIEAVKSPMYATTVGLVLAGYRSIDERVNRGFEPEEQVYRPAPEQQHRVETPAAPAPLQKAPQAPAPPKKPSGAGKFFQDIISRTKGLLIDDFDDKQY
jgi:cell division protein FtsA